MNSSQRRLSYPNSAIQPRASMSAARTEKSRRKSSRNPLKYRQMRIRGTYCFSASWFPLSVATLCGRRVGLRHLPGTSCVFSFSFLFLHMATTRLAVFDTLCRVRTTGRLGVAGLLETFSFVKLEFAFLPTGRDSGGDGLPGDPLASPSSAKTMDQRITHTPLSTIPCIFL